MNSEYSYLSARPDGLIIDAKSSAKFGVLELKTYEGTFVMTNDIRVQIHLSMLCAGVDKCFLGQYERKTQDFDAKVIPLDKSFIDPYLIRIQKNYHRFILPYYAVF